MRLGPCTIALDAPTKLRLRFAGLRVADRDALVELISRYQQSPDGALAPDALPPSLRGRLSAASPKTPCARHPSSL